jgi:hypothetical protein
MTLKSIVPAMFAGARRAAAGPVIVEQDERPDTIVTMIATALAVVVVALIAVLLGMS